MYLIFSIYQAVQRVWTQNSPTAEHERYLADATDVADLERRMTP